MIHFVQMMTIAGLLSAVTFSCKDTTIVDPPASKTNDQFHGDIVGLVTQKESHAVVYISQVKVVDSTAINPTDGSFKFSNVLLGNYDMTVRADDFRIFERSNVIVRGGGVVYVGTIDLSTTPDLVSSYYPMDQDEIVYDRRFAGIAISIIFTHPMDRKSVDSAFSTNLPSTGIFDWRTYTYSHIYYLYSDASYFSPVNIVAQITTYS